MNLLKFHGKFRDLIPNGFRFHKLFAKNYRSYSKSISPAYDIWIWQHHGGYVEIDPFGSTTANAVKVILNDNSPWERFLLGSKSEYKKYYFNTTTFEVVPNSVECYDMMTNYCNFKRSGYSEDESLKKSEDKCRNWTTVVVSPEYVEAIKWLIEKKWIQIITA